MPELSAAFLFTLGAIGDVQTHGLNLIGIIAADGSIITNAAGAISLIYWPLLLLPMGHQGQRLSTALHYGFYLRLFYNAGFACANSVCLVND